MTLTAPPSRILIVDDLPENIQVLARILGRKGHEIDTAQSGEEALKVIEQNIPDLILLDVMMPGGLDGFQLCQRLSESPRTRLTPVIFVSALTNSDNILRGFSVGGVDYIGKPFRPREVLARVNAHLTIQQQRREMEAMRERDRANYQRLSEMKDDVLQMTSHDLKNPLNNFKTALYLLQKHGCIDDDGGRKYLEILEGNVQQMQDLITNLLDLARFETGQAPDRQAVSLDDFMRRTLNPFDFNAQQKRITLDYQPPAADIQVMIDAERLGQAISNLLSNAIKYTTEGGAVRVAVATNGLDWRIVISDNGIGIPQNALPHIFDKFYRVNEDQHRHQEGTGLGLSIVKSIVEQHEGQISVTSTPDEGTTFTLTLPLYEMDDAATPQ
ncbi:MAG: hybrid sensor histidine kinase/response regulator [Anaerolineaceae bacterium]|nr:MAG: hybrid sensor histidine kinase/response regulator [Anaerolineaceae bacterium]